MTNDFSPFRGNWLEEVDDGLAQLGTKAVRTTDFTYGSLPSELPSPEDFPRYGEWTVEQCREALAQWEENTPEQRQALDSEVLAAIESCAGWWREAAAADRGIAAFNH